MRLLILSIILSFVVFSTTYSLEPVRGAVKYTGGGSVTIEVQLYDFGTSTNVYPGAGNQSLGSLSANSSGIIAFAVGKDDAAWAAIDPSTVTNNYLIIVYVDGIVSAYLKLDNTMLQQAVYGSEISEDVISIPDGEILVGDSNDDAVSRTLGGDGSLNNLGELSVTGLQGRTLDATAPSNGQTLVWNNVTSQWEPGAIVASSVFATVGNVTSNGPGDEAADDFVFGSYQLDDTGDSDYDAKFLFDKSKGAFRAGYTGGDDWDDANRGNYSVAFGLSTLATADFSAVGGGWGNNASGDASTISGGSYNTASNTRSSVGGGTDNDASGQYSTISGGMNNTATQQHSSVGGGEDNDATNNFATISGGYDNTASGIASTIGGGQGNEASESYSTISGGMGNTATSSYSTVGGGSSNDALGQYSTIGGGQNNYIIAIGANSTICGGRSNIINEDNSAIVGGYDHQIDQEYSVISGGYENRVNSEYSTISGGRSNYISGDYCIIPGGNNNQARGDYSLVFGNDIFPVADEDYRVYFFNNDYPGMVAINREDADHPIHVGVIAQGNGNGAHLTDGGVWTNSSSITFKDRFSDLDENFIINSIKSLPVKSWYYKNSDERHIGPFAEDFYRVFGTGDLNSNDVSKYISTMDVAGVSLRGVQILLKEIEKIDELEEKNKNLEVENKRLRNELDQMWEIINKLQERIEK